MKTILITTDFSQAAHNASLYGIQLAKAFQAKVVLFNVYQQPVIPPLINEGLIITPPPQAAASVLDYLNIEAGAINQDNQVPVDTICEEGSADKLIIDKAIELKADLIVMGMKGSGKNVRKLFGSTVTAISRKTTIPLLIVPEEGNFTLPKTIVLANDLATGTEIHALDLLQELGEKFNSKIFVVRVIQNHFNEVYDMLLRPIRLNKLLKNLDTSYEFPKNHNVAHALNEFINKHAVDMVAMIPHRHNLLERLFTKSDSKAMIYHTHVPLLLLPDKIHNYNLETNDAVHSEEII